MSDVQKCKIRTQSKFDNSQVEMYQIRTESRSETGKNLQCAGSKVQNQKVEPWSKVQAEVTNADEQQA